MHRKRIVIRLIFQQLQSLESPSAKQALLQFDLVVILNKNHNKIAQHFVFDECQLHLKLYPKIHSDKVDFYNMDNNQSHFARHLSRQSTLLVSVTLKLQK